jgi:hypothetical protein
VEKWKTSKSGKPPKWEAKMGGQIFSEFFESRAGPEDENMKTVKFVQKIINRIVVGPKNYFLF